MELSGKTISHKVSEVGKREARESFREKTLNGSGCESRSNCFLEKIAN